MKFRFVALAALPILLSGCTEVISFTAGFGAGYFTGQYMTKRNAEAANKTSAARMRTINSANPNQRQGQAGYPNARGAQPYGGAYGQPQAAPQNYGSTMPQADYYARDEFAMQRSPIQPQGYGDSMQAQPYGQPSAMMSSPQTDMPMPYGVNPQTPPPTSMMAPSVPSPTAALSPAPVASGTPYATYQPITPMTPVVPVMPQQTMMMPVPVSPMPMQIPMAAPQTTGGYYVAPITMAPIQTMPPLANNSRMQMAPTPNWVK